MPRRIVPTPVNRTAHISMALRKLIKEQENLLKKARNRKRMSSIVKNMIVNMYANTLRRQRPAVNMYQVRSAVPRGKNLHIRRENLRRRLFGNNK